MIATIPKALDRPRLSTLPVGPVGLVGAFVRRDWANALSYKLPFVLGLAQSFSTVGFLYFLSRLIGPRIYTASGGLHGGYFAFAILGTTLLGLFSVTLVTFAQRLRSDQTTGTLEVLFTMPPSPALIVLASAAYNLLLSLLAATLTLALAIGVGMRLSTSTLGVILALSALVVSLALFCSAGIAFAAFVIVFKRGETLVGLGASALSLIGGVYYPITLMPHTLRVVAEVLPFTWSLQIIRSSLLSTNLPIARFGELCAATFVAFPLAVWLFARALRRARRSGTLGQY